MQRNYNDDDIKEPRGLVSTSRLRSVWLAARTVQRTIWSGATFNSKKRESATRPRAS